MDDIGGVHCKSCGYAVALNFCPNCGQKAAIKRISIRQLFLDIPRAVFHLDSGFFYNLQQLFKRPGDAIKEFLAGRRKPYFHPIAYLAILLLFNYFAVKVTNLHYYDEAELTTLSPEQARQIVEYDASQWWFLEHTYLYMLIAIPVCSLFLFLFFSLFRFRYNLAECAVILMFIIAQGVFIQSVVYLLTGWVHNGLFIRTMETLNLLLLWSYAAYGLYDMLKPARRKTGVALACIGGALAILLLMVASAYWLMDLSQNASA